MYKSRSLPCAHMHIGKWENADCADVQGAQDQTSAHDLLKCEEMVPTCNSYPNALRLLQFFLNRSIASKVCHTSDNLSAH